MKNSSRTALTLLGLVSAMAFPPVIPVVQAAERPVIRKGMRSSLINFDDTFAGGGIITVNVTAAGGVSGQLALADKIFRFAGRADADGHFETVLKSPVGKTIPDNVDFGPYKLAVQQALKPKDVKAPVQLQLDLIGGDGEGSFGVIVDGLGSTGARLRELAKFSKAYPNTFSGIYNVSASGSSSQQTECYWGLHTKVSASGAVTVIGFAPDGTALTAAGSLYKDFFGQDQAGWDGAQEFVVSLYSTRYNGKGMFLGEGRLTPGAMGFSAASSMLDIYGVITRPAAPNTAFLPDGYSFQFSGRGGKYVRGATRPLGFTDPSNGFGDLTVLLGVAGDYDALSDDFVMGKNGVFRFVTSNHKMALSLNPATGLAVGSFLDLEGVRRQIKAILSDERLLSEGGPELKGTAIGKTRPYVMFAEGTATPPD